MNKGQHSTDSNNCHYFGALKMTLRCKQEVEEEKRESIFVITFNTVPILW
jgi:hypothetical protein